MFDQLTIDGNSRAGKPWSFAASLTVQTGLVAVALILPLLRVAKLEPLPTPAVYAPRRIGTVKLVPVPSSSVPANPQAPSHAARTYRPFTAPANIHHPIATGPDLPDAPAYAIGNSGPAGDLNGTPDGLPPQITELHPMTLPPPPRPATRPAVHTVAPVRVGEGVQMAKLIFGPKPDYPPLAKQARISGTVRLGASISADGHIHSLQVLSGHPMLVQAALDAVRRWLYRPTLLNGEPVEVLTEIQVNFLLNQ